MLPKSSRRKNNVPLFLRILSSHESSSRYNGYIFHGRTASRLLLLKRCGVTAKSACTNVVLASRSRISEQSLFFGCAAISECFIKTYLEQNHRSIPDVQRLSMVRLSAESQQYLYLMINNMSLSFLTSCSCNIHPESTVLVL